MIQGFSLKNARVVGSAALLAVVLVLGGGFPTFGAGVSFELNQSQGFNFQRDVQDPIGFLKALKVGTNEIKADMKLRDPNKLTVDPKNLSNYVGVLSKISWAGGIGDPIELSIHISTYNKQVISTLLHKTLENIQVEFGFIVHDYDPLKKQYFPAFFGGTTPNEGSTRLKGLIYKEGGKELQLKIEGKGTEVTSPENWILSLKVIPQTLQQSINFAVAVGMNVVKQWGTATAK